MTGPWMSNSAKEGAGSLDDVYHLSDTVENTGRDRGIMLLCERARPSSRCRPGVQEELAIILRRLEPIPSTEFNTHRA